MQLKENLHKMWEIINDLCVCILFPGKSSEELQIPFHVKISALKSGSIEFTGILSLTYVCLLRFFLSFLDIDFIIAHFDSLHVFSKGREGKI